MRVGHVTKLNSGLAVTINIDKDVLVGLTNYGSGLEFNFHGQTPETLYQLAQGLIDIANKYRNQDIKDGDK